jgi:hypothetical protein
LNSLRDVEAVGLRHGDQFGEGRPGPLDESAEVARWLVNRESRPPQRDDLCDVGVALTSASLVVGHGDVACVSLSVLIERLSHRTDTIS